ncbi:hypothetical protein GpartN1_g3735.t1 [Galdieria partita]|uniref:Uncharacterized protein n=1 Tax=Galdieria partita TaxID=83374 RepID=A0A9C7PXF1_9RHOD|nr:hypothetical protein GpartN1_g3735.t1 [Galdieria partita]
MKTAVFVFFVVALCAITIQASPLEDTLGAFMRGGYQAPRPAPGTSCCKLSCQYTQICEQVVQTQQVIQTQQVVQSQQVIQTQQVVQSQQVSSAYGRNEVSRGGYSSQSVAPAPAPSSCVSVPVKCCIECSSCYQQVSPVQVTPSQQVYQTQQVSSQSAY